MYIDEELLTCHVNIVLMPVQEGPHSVLNEEEFYDAIETALDRQDEEDAILVSVLYYFFLQEFFLMTVHLTARAWEGSWDDSPFLFVHISLYVICSVVGN